jgi:CYTH domain-containing protein
LYRHALLSNCANNGAILRVRTEGGVKRFTLHRQRAKSCRAEIELALPGQPDTAQAQQAATGAMPVVVVKAKRMTALEKRQSQELDTSPRSAAAGS